MALKRSFENLSEIDYVVPGAEVHFAVEVLSPIKKGRSGVDYYDAFVTDGTKKMRLVGFDETSQSKLAKLSNAKKSIQLQNCQIKNNNSNILEIIVNRTTQITESQKKLNINIEPVKTETATDVNVIDINSVDDGNIVNLTAIIVSIAPPRVVATGIVQDIQIADSTGEIPLSAWDVNVNKFEQSQIYFFRNLTVRTYRNKKSLTLTKQSSYTITQTELLINDDTDPLQQFTNASIVGVQHFNSHYSCVNCSSRLVNTDNEYGRCSKCSILQSVSICKVDVSCNIFFQNNQNSILLKVSTGIIALLPRS